MFESIVGSKDEVFFSGNSDEGDVTWRGAIGVVGGEDIGKEKSGGEDIGKANSQKLSSCEFSP